MRLDRTTGADANDRPNADLHQFIHHDAQRRRAHAAGGRDHRPAVRQLPHIAIQPAVLRELLHVAQMALGDGARPVGVAAEQRQRWRLLPQVIPAEADMVENRV